MKIIDSIRDWLLFRAIDKGSNIVAWILIMILHANVNAKRITVVHEESAIHAAVQHRRKFILRLLLGKKANVNARMIGRNKSPLGWTAFYQACINGDTEFMEILRECGANINAKDDYGNNILHVMIKMQRTRMTRILIDMGADIYEKTQGWSPLDLAVQFNCKEVATHIRVHMRKA